MWRRRRWRSIDPETRAETTLDASVAASLMSRAYMIYAPLPERVTAGQVWRFSIFGASGDIGRLLVAAAAATLAALLIPVTTSAVLGHAVPDGRTSLLGDMMILLFAASIGSAGFQVVRAIALVRLGMHIDVRLQAAVWDRVMRLRTSFFRRYSVGDLASRILGIDLIRRILAGQTINGLISGVFSLASLGVMLIYDAWLALFAAGYAIVAAAFLYGLGRAQMRLQRIVYTRKGILMGLLVEIVGGIAKLPPNGAPLPDGQEASPNSAPTTPGRDGSALGSSSLRRASPSSARSASWQSPAAATIRSRSPPSRPSTAPLVSSPQP
jgi:ABC-type bacteriocin/lantibiotic exporter with double-glycine peptidase domain